ncbi:hypothetical protein Droror1_Dr00007533 [Drosera rotundifolia]
MEYRDPEVGVLRPTERVTGESMCQAGMCTRQRWVPNRSCGRRSCVLRPTERVPGEGGYPTGAVPGEDMCPTEVLCLAEELCPASPVPGGGVVAGGSSGCLIVGGKECRDLEVGVLRPTKVCAGRGCVPDGGGCPAGAMADEGVYPKGMCAWRSDGVYVVDFLKEDLGCEAKKWFVVVMSPVLSEILRSGFIIDSSLRRRTHLVQSFSVVFLYWFYVFS